MDHEKRSRGGEKRVSLLQGNHEFFNKKISRDSTVGCSSRIYYYRNPEGVPFKWEMQPGTAKDPPKDEAIPPLSPPPAVLSKGLPKPCIREQPKAPTWQRFRLWKKKSKKNKPSKKIVELDQQEGSRVTGSDKSERFEFCNSDSEFMASPERESRSSSSSSLSFPNGPTSLDSSRRLQSPAAGRDSLFHGTFVRCSPWNISSILVSIARRV